MSLILIQLAIKDNIITVQEVQKKELKGASLDKFLLKKQGKRWDGVPVPYVGVEDLDSSAIEFFKQKALKKKRIDSDILDEDNKGLIEKLHLFEVII